MTDGLKLQIEKLWPTGHANIWGAEFKFTTPDELIGDVGVAHNIIVRARFSCDEEATTESLLNAAYSKAVDSLRFALSAAENSSLEEFRVEERQRIEEANKPFEFTPNLEAFGGGPC